MDISLVISLYQNSGMSPDQFIVWANSIVYTPVIYFVSYRSIRYTLSQISGPAAAKAETESIMALVSSADTLAHSMLMVPGDINGNGGGIDISLPESQAMIDAIQSEGILNQIEADSIRNLGRTGTPRYVSWGCGQFGQAEMAAINGISTSEQALQTVLPTGAVLGIPPDGGYEVTFNNIYIRYNSLPTLDQVNAYITKFLTIQAQAQASGDSDAEGDD